MPSNRSRSRSRSRSTRRSRSRSRSKNPRLNRQSSRQRRQSSNTIRGLSRPISYAQFYGQERRPRRISSEERSARRQASRETARDPCPPGQILRKGYRRRSYTRRSRSGSTVRVPVTSVGPTCVPDFGQPGKGPRVIPPLTANLLRQFGYSASANESQRHSAIDEAIEEYGPLDVYRHLRNIVTLQRWNPESHDVMLDDVKYIRNKYYPHRIGKYEPVNY